MSWEMEKTNVNKLIAIATSARGTLNSVASAGNEGSNILRGKKLIKEIFVISTKRETVSAFKGRDRFDVEYVGILGSTA